MKNGDDDNGNGNGDEAIGVGADAPPTPPMPPHPPQHPHPPQPPQGPQPTMPPQGWQPPPGYYAPPPGYYPPPPPKPRKRISNKPTVVGSILAIVAVLGLIMAIGGGVALAMFGSIDEWFPGEEGDTTTLNGQVTYPNGTGIPGVTVSVSGEAITTFTDSEGYFVLYAVPMGDLTITATKAGHVTVNYRVTVIGGTIFSWESQEPGKDLDIVMTEGTGTVTSGSWFDEDWAGFGTFIAVCVAIMLICSLLALLGAYYAFKRQNVHFVVIGAIAGIFTIGFGIGSVLAFVALFILLLSLDEFRSKGEENEDE